MKEQDRPTLVIDATNAVLGRLASYAAKQALMGKNVIIVNCNEAVVTGNRSNILLEYRIARQRGGASLKGPNYPKHPERLVKRTVRGMLYYRHGRGKDAFKRVMCYNAVPKEYESKKKEIVKRVFMTNTIKLSDITKEL